MVNAKNIGIALGILILAVLAALWLWPDEEKAVRKQLAVLDDAGSKALDEKPLETIQRAARIGALFHDPCRLVVETDEREGDYSRKEIIDRVVMVRSSLGQARVETHDLKVDFPSKGAALLVFTLRLVAASGGERHGDVHEVEARMAKIEGDWLFTELKIIEVMER